MATIYGSFSKFSTSIFQPYISYSYTQSIPNNQSTISWTLYFAKYNAGYYAYNNSFSPCVISVNGTVFSGSESFNLNPPNTLEAVRSGVTVVNHNADGTKSIWIGSNGDTGSGVLGTFNFGQTVALTTIPREASITSSSNLTIENDLAFTLNNPGSLYCKMEFWIYGNSGWYKVLTQNNGTGSSGTMNLDPSYNSAMYSRLPNVTSASCKLRVYTYSNSGYTTQVGSYDDQDGTVSINQTTNKPTFTDWSVAPVDKTVDVEDKYSNLLVSSSTDTLRGSADAVIKGYELVRATISSGNKMVPLNYSTGNKYRFTGTGYDEDAYDTGEVTIDLDNQIVKDFTTTAYDSRNLTTAVNKSITTLIDYESVSLWGLTITRDNGVDSTVNMEITGSYFDGDFIAGGVTNTQTAHYRYKESTVSWGAQTWNSLTLTDTSGALSYNDAIEGDLGVEGFDSAKSYDIEVRLYDKLSVIIVEKTLDKGEPVMDITAEGVAFGELYDTETGGALQAKKINIGGTIYRTGTPKSTSATYDATGAWVDHSYYLNVSQPLWNGATYYADPFGFVHLGGLVKSGGTGSPGVFQLPPQYSPSRVILHASMSNSKDYTRVDIQSNSTASGQVRQILGNNGWLLLDQVRFAPFLDGWQVPTFEGSWVNYASRATATQSSYNQCAYYKDELGFVHLAGMAKSGTIGHGTAIFTLPAGYRPEADLMFQTISSSTSATATVVVHSDGTVDCHQGGNGWVTLEGIYFMSDTSPYWSEWAPITLSNGFVDTAVSGYMGAMEWISPDGVYHIMGMVDNGDTVTGAQKMFELPDEVADNMPYRRMFRCVTKDGTNGIDTLRVDPYPSNHATNGGNVMATTEFVGIGDEYTSISGNRLRIW